MAADDSSKALLTRIREELYSGVVHDVLDEMGYRNQALPARIKPLEPHFRVVGRAATMLAVPVSHPSESKPFGFTLEFLDGLSSGEVVVGSVQSDDDVSVWGEIMSTAAATRGAQGVVLDGYGRDADFIRKMGFPAFFTGLSPKGAVGRVEVRHVRIPIKIGNVDVRDGNLVIGDCDGCIVIPREVEPQVLDAAFAKVAAETKVRAELQAGANIVDMYAKYGVL